MLAITLYTFQPSITWHHRYKSQCLSRRNAPASDSSSSEACTTLSLWHVRTCGGRREGNVFRWDVWAHQEEFADAVPSIFKPSSSDSSGSAALDAIPESMSPLLRALHIHDHLGTMTAFHHQYKSWRETGLNIQDLISAPDGLETAVLQRGLHSVLADATSHVSILYLPFRGLVYDTIMFEIFKFVDSRFLCLGMCQRSTGDSRRRFVVCGRKRTPMGFHLF